ncbi:four helix bundle protein [Mucilaginibacter aquariorum]|uniref:Four helix bundle protein n=1 Tax=Mucilaginibacter aquariorum TaxID=2967225 RepID=A0ABT1SX16_9SPHI|nr:four helix bundle protein [Mucilaginibacter aquariorum]MCQ6956797.1 four helix bundle protein [Mucilaginibacter aquariorum]
MSDSERVDFAESLKKRTKKFVVDNIKLFRTLPKTEEAKIIGRQLLRCSSSVGANYRAVCRARSQAEFHSKLSIVVEEADESVFWMEILVEAGIVQTPEIESLFKEANEILKIVSASRRTVSEKK